MKEKNHMSVFFRRFIRTLLFIIFLFAVGFLSYGITHLYYKLTDAEKNVKSDSIINDLINNTDVEDVSKNLILSVDEETGAIKHLVLEIFNTDTGNLDYITIPVDTEFTITNELYQKLYSNNNEVPQIVKLKNLSDYFDSDTLCPYTALLIEDLIDVDINYYTEIPSTLYDELFTTTTSNKQALEVQTLSDSVTNEVESIDSKTSLKEYITKIYEQVNSNLTLNNKLKYLDAFYELDFSQIYYYSLFGENEGTNFTVDVKRSNELISEILGNDSYDASQSDSEGLGADEVSSKGLNIQILNGSKIPGLAAKFQEKLTLSGFTITGIGNYEDEVLTNTKIIVKDDTMGSDLVENFNDPEVVVGELPDGVDMQIILGTNDNILQ